MRHRLLPWIPALLLQGCLSNAGRIDHTAQVAGLERSVVTGTTYRHVVYASDEPASAPTSLVVYLDGDGLPWGRDGQHEAADPTTRDPLALRLLIAGHVPGVYLSRPCYQELKDPGCSPRRWTAERYSDEVVASLAAAIRKIAAANGSPRVTLAGYSGGGVLAVLVAERLDNVAGVVTLSANLDTDAWTAQHGYLPLTGSLNPATSTRLHPWPEWHLQGGRDTVVPASTTDEYFHRYPQARRETFAQYDHVCCWVDAWPALLQAFRKEREERAER